MDIYEENTKLKIIMRGGEYYEGYVAYAREDYLNLREFIQYPFGNPGYGHNIFRINIASIHVLEYPEKKPLPKKPIISKEKEERLAILSTNAIYINKRGIDFRAALQVMSSCTEIAIHYIGNTKEYKFRFPMLTVYAAHKIYLFDTKMELNFFQIGLEKIMESKSIQKIVYDSKHFGSVLRKHFNVSLNNVLDILVCDAVLEDKKTLPISTELTLADCIQKHLEISDEKTSELRIPVMNWIRRPLLKTTAKSMALYSAYLFLLKKAVLKKLLKDFHETCDNYLVSARTEPKPSLLDINNPIYLKPRNIDHWILTHGLQDLPL